MMLRQIKLRDVVVQLPKVYLAVLVMGILLGWKTSLVFDSEIFGPGDSIFLKELAWPLAGILMGMAFYGAGPVIPLFLLGIYNGNVISAVTRETGGIFLTGESVTLDISQKVLEMNFGLLESFAFLYGAIGGMYLAVYHLEITEGYEAGMIQDETQRWNFMVKSRGSLFLAFVVASLRILV